MRCLVPLKAVPGTSTWVWGALGAGLQEAGMEGWGSERGKRQSQCGEASWKPLRALLWALLGSAQNVSQICPQRKGGWRVYALLLPPLGEGAPRRAHFLTLPGTLARRPRRLPWGGQRLGDLFYPERPSRRLEAGEAEQPCDCLDQCG